MKIVAVTSCAGGIAHTYMAAEGLKKAAKASGDEIRIEIQGSMGIEQELKKADIEAAEIVILAADIGIRGKERFVGKKIIEIQPGEVIAKPNEAFNKVKKLAGIA